MKQGYAFQEFDREKMARALGRDLPISVKHSSMVCNAIRGKSVERAKKILEDAIQIRKAIPFTKYNTDKGHKKKMGPGRYAVHTCMEILKLLNSAEANGHQKNLEGMEIVHICAHKASKPWHSGRQRRRQMKRSHIEIVVSSGHKKEEKQEQEKKEKARK